MANATVSAMKNVLIMPALHCAAIITCAATSFLLERLDQRLDWCCARAVTAGPHMRHHAERTQACDELPVRSQRTRNIAGRRPEIDDPTKIGVGDYGNQ